MTAEEIAKRDQEFQEAKARWEGIYVQILPIAMAQLVLLENMMYTTEEENEQYLLQAGVGVSDEVLNRIQGYAWTRWYPPGQIAWEYLQRAVARRALFHVHNLPEGDDWWVQKMCISDVVQARLGIEAAIERYDQGKENK